MPDPGAQRNGDPLGAPPPRARGLWARLALGAAVIVLASGSASAVAFFREIDRVVSAFKQNAGLDLGTDLAEADAGKPQTIMLIGSDKRAKTARDAQTGAVAGARSDTIILARLDPSKEATALLSLPRDLKVRIPGVGTGKLNAAFDEGGTRLTVRTVKQLTGLRINHVINVDFGGFKEAVNAIGCVYVDIDRRYFNDNSGPQQYATIDVKQGYQKLCGQKALDYVRYRHEDGDLVRAARQQEFLRQAKQQVGVGRLVRDRDRLVRIFGRYTQSDIRSREAVLRLLKLAVASAGRPIREVHFKGRVTEGDAARGIPSYVTASSAAIRKVTREFLGVEASRGPRGKLKPQDRDRPRRRSRGRAPLEDAAGAGREQARQARSAGARIPVFHPTRRARNSLFLGEPRVYAIRSPDGRVHSSYRMVLKRGLVGEYYGLQGTSWKEAPILAQPSEKRRLGGRTYELHYDGDRLRLVAWRTPEAVYWVSNTLLLSLSERQMLGIARSARPL